MNPIQKYLRSFFAKKRIVGDTPLQGLAAADALLSDLVNENKVPGLALTVMKKGEVFFQRGYGHANLENRIPADPKNTVFRIASVSKPIAATALAKMVYDELIDLDASFYEYVPYYPSKKWDFTIRQLASHTAGIRGYRGIEYGLNQAYSIAESIEIFKDDDLLFEPGKGYQYNSFDWVMISLAMQEASGMPFEKYVEDYVLEPLAMNYTFAPNVKNRIDTQLEEARRESPDLHLAKFYSKNRSGFRDAISVNNHYKLAGGGYLSTTEDIAKLGQAYLDNKVLPPEIKNQFLTAQEVNGQSTYYGLGWQVSSDIHGRPYYGHVGNGVGGYSNFYVYPEHEMVFSILINCTDPKVQDDLDKIVNALFTPST
ncbi:CubicO group peptidase (beta-lactamase class C family) [Flavobacteriaceae bacterium MAR_2009_75]|nr:CubicO group peptidase (beta-lactamase class C family) [Flavobacteriaceae bacterium MAR_2009_75]